METFLYMLIVFYFIGIRGQLLPVVKSGVNLILFESSVSAPHSVAIENCKDLLERDAYNPTLKNWFYIPGYRGRKNGTCVNFIVQVALALRDRNVFVLDYEDDANPPPLTDYGSLTDSIYYSIAAKKALEDGKLLGKCINNMEDTGKFNLSMTTIVGFSLGAHVAGSAGKELKSLGGQLSQIIGLDPAAPLFEDPPVYTPLNKEDAQNVHVMHTDLHLAMNKTMGTSDVWINFWIYISGFEKNEQVQPACPPRNSEMFSPNNLCSHNFCILIYAQSMKTYIECGKATSYEAYKAGQITATSGLGDKLDLSATGNYYVNTSGCPPYDLNTVCQNPGAPLTENCQAAT